MSLTLFVLWAVVGWAAYTPNPDPPDPPPEGPLPPMPCRVCGFVLGLVAGVIGGWAYTQMFPAQDLNLKSGLYAATTALGAFVASRFATGIYRLAFNRRG